MRANIILIFKDRHLWKRKEFNHWTLTTRYRCEIQVKYHSSITATIKQIKNSQSKTRIIRKIKIIPDSKPQTQTHAITIAFSIHYDEQIKLGNGNGLDKVAVEAEVGDVGAQILFRASATSSAVATSATTTCAGTSASRHHDERFMGWFLFGRICCLFRVWLLMFELNWRDEGQKWMGRIWSLLYATTPPNHRWPVFLSRILCRDFWVWGKRSEMEVVVGVIRLSLAVRWQVLCGFSFQYHSRSDPRALLL